MIHLSQFFTAADHHYLVVPNRHYEKVSRLTPDDIPMIRRMAEIGRQVLVERAGRPGTRADDMDATADVMADAKIGFHWPLVSVGHLHLHLMYPASSMGLISRIIYSNTFFGDVDTAIAFIESNTT